MLVTVLLFLLAADLNSASEWYTAAVVEYHAPANPTLAADQVLLNNAQVFVQYITNASAHQVDIIVFPEGGLHGHGSRNKFIKVPSATGNIAPCDHTAYHPALVLLSCTARKLRMYVVVNLSEKFNNATNGTEYYNTNVALDRNGTVVGRYRKFNPYGESVKKPPLPDHHYFETDFGARFAMFTCFDVDFLEPAIVMARQFGIKHFVFPLCWISELPFLSALQTQWGWAYSLDVVLLAAGCNNPQGGGSGSGIYVGRQGALTTFQTNAVASKMLIAQVPLNLTKGTDSPQASIVYQQPTNPRYLTDDPVVTEVRLLDDVGPRTTSTVAQTNTTLAMLRDYLDVYESFPLVPSPAPPGPSGSVNISSTWDKTLCQNGLCCRFQLRTISTFSTSAPTEPTRGDDFSRYPYRLVMFDGVRWYGGGIATGGVQVCGIVSCVNDSITSCGLRADDSSRQVQTIGPSTDYGLLYKTATVFESITVTPIFSYNSTFIFPDIFVAGRGDSFGSLVHSDTFDFTTSEPSDGYVMSSLHIKGPIPNLITAGVYARQFDRDGENRTVLSSVACSRAPYSIIMIFVMSLFVVHYMYVVAFSSGITLGFKQ